MKASKSDGGPEWQQLYDEQATQTRYGAVNLIIAAAFLLCTLVLYTYPYAQSTPLQQELFSLFFLPIGPPLIFLWMWGLIVHHFESSEIQYNVCFDRSLHPYLRKHNEIYMIAGVFSCVAFGGLAAYNYLCHQHWFLEAAYAPGLFYGVIFGMLLLPGSLVHGETRIFFSKTLWRVLFPFQLINFADFLLADILTSLSKSTSDVAVTICALSSGAVEGLHKSASEGQEVYQEVVANCGLHVAVPVMQALPYIIRLIQCLLVWQYRDEKSQFWNALKYSSMFPCILLGYRQRLLASVNQDTLAEQMRTYVLLAQLLNTSFSYYWDLERDWEMSYFRQGWPFVPIQIKNNRLYQSLLPYYWLVVSNLGLRCLAFVKILFPAWAGAPSMAMLLAVLEIYRRAQWVPVRIEHELRKISNKNPEVKGVLTSFNPPQSQTSKTRS